MAEETSAPAKMTEPRVIDCVLCEGVILEVRDELVRVVGYVDLETAPEANAERRIVLRAALPTLVVRSLIRDLRRAVARGGH